MPHLSPAGVGRRIGAQLAIAWLSLFGLFSVVTLFAFTIAHDHRTLIAESHERGRLESLVLTDQAARLLESADLALVTLVDDMNGMNEAQAARSRSLFTRLTRLADRLPFVEAIWFHGANGRLWMTSRTFPAPPEDASGKDFIVAHRQGVDVHIGPPVGDTFRLSRRIQSPSGGLRGIASITIEIRFFRTFYERLDLPPGSTVTLLSAEGLQPLVQQPTGEHLQLDASAHLHDAITQAPTMGTFRVKSPADGGDRIYSYRKVPQFPLYVTVSQPLDISKWNRRLRGRLMTAAAAVTTLGILTWLGLREAGNQRRFQDTLAARVTERTRQLEQAVHEVHHRVNNNLQIVITLLIVQLGRITDPQVREALVEGIGRIGTIGLAHRVMYGNGAVSELLFGDYLRTLGRQMADLYGGEYGEMAVTGENPSLPLETAVPLALLVHELLAAGPRSGNPAIHLDQTDDIWRLTMHNVRLPPPGHLAADIAMLLAAQLGATLQTKEVSPFSVTVTWKV